MSPPRPTAGSLQRVNLALAEVLRREPARLSLGADAALRDEIVLCGLLGGKDVGKSTLINALAGARVSVDERKVGEGTDRPIAFVHEEERDAVTDRLRDLTRRTELRIVPHRSDALRGAVLVDLPDFDSEFPDHLGIVRAIAPLLDRVVWVLTPRKIGDRAWVEMFHSVIKDQRNVRCVLNKIDELLTDGDALVGSNGDAGRGSAFWNRQREWVASSLSGAGFDSAGAGSFLVASGFPTRDAFRDRVAALWDDPGWSRYGSDKSAVEDVAERAAAEFDRLRDSVLSPLSGEEVAALKRANRDREQHVAADRIRSHYDLPRRIEELTHACDASYLQSVFDESFDPALVGAIAESQEAQLGSDARLADDLLERRIEGYPLLRMVMWPLGWVSRLVGRRIGPGGGDRRVAPADPFDIGGPTLENRIDGMKARLLSDHAALDAKLGIGREMPETASLARATRRAIAELGPKTERRLIDAVRATDERPSRMLSLFLWSVLLWFPLVQPIAAGLLSIAANPEMGGLAQGALQIVLAFGATKLLAGFAVVGVVYVIVLATMYARARRAIRRVRTQLAETDPVHDAVDESLTTTVLVPLVAPFRERLERLTALDGQLPATDAASSSVTPGILDE